jgi:hypothetical protein
MPEPAVAEAPTSSSPASPPSPWASQTPVGDWYRHLSPYLPPETDYEVVESRAVPPLAGEHSRTTVTTRAGVTMTIIVTWAEANDSFEGLTPAQIRERAQTGWWNHVRYHVVTNNVQPRLHMQSIVSLELAADNHGAVVNQLVREVQNAVLQRRREVAEALEQRQRALETRMLEIYATPFVTFGTSNANAGTTIGNYNTYTMNLTYNYAGTAGTVIPPYINAPHNGTYTGQFGVTRQPLSAEETEKIKARLAEEEKLIKEANRRAEDLLLDVLGEMGFARYKKKGYVVVMSRTKPGVVYHVKGMAGIDLFERVNGKIISLKEYLCIHPRDIYPEADTIAAQVLMCRFDEENLWKTANRHKRDNGMAINMPPYVNPALINFAA